MKHAKTTKIISNILFGLGSALGIAVLIKTYIDSADLPPGVCPLDQNRGLTYAALIVLGASLVFSFVTDFLSRRQRRNGDQ